MIQQVCHWPLESTHVTIECSVIGVGDELVRLYSVSGVLHLLMKGVNLGNEVVQAIVEGGDGVLNLWKCPGEKFCNK